MKKIIDILLLKNLSEKQKDIAVIAYLIFTILIFLTPCLFKWEGMLYDDGLGISFPRLHGIARYFCQSEIPLWDPDTFYGARPFYNMLEHSLFNPFYLILNLFADSNDLNQSVIFVFLVPYSLFIIFGALGGFFFSRKVLKLNRTGSYFSALVLALSPHMAATVNSVLNSGIFAYVPWILLALCKFIENQKIKWWVLGIVFLSLMSCGANINYTYRIYLVTGFIVLLNILFTCKFTKKALIIFLMTSSIYLLSLTLAGFLWAGTIEGLKWMGTGTFNAVPDIKLSRVEANLDPAFLISLFIPNFFGMPTWKHSWGSALCQDGHSTIPGGMIYMFIIAGSIYYLLKNKKLNGEEQALKKWTYIGIFTFLFTLSVMMGRHTILLPIIGFFMPFLKVPHPIYYRFSLVLSLSILFGIGVSMISGSKKMREVIFNNKFISFYLLLIILISVFSVFRMHKGEDANYMYKAFMESEGITQAQVADKNTGEIKFRNIDTLFLYKEVKWFITNPLLYTAVITAVLFMLSVKKNNNKFLKITIFASLFLEIIVLSYCFFYKNTMSARPTSNPTTAVIRYKNPYDFFICSLSKNYKEKINDNNHRFIAFSSTIDNFAWYIGAKSALGYDSKPVMNKYFNAINDVVENWPFALQLTKLNYNLFNNLSIKYLISEVPFEENEFLKEYANFKINVRGEYYTLKVYSFNNTMPFISFQDKIYPAASDEQLKFLKENNCKLTALICNDDINNIPQGNIIDPENNSKKDYIGMFDDLQVKNKILKINNKKADKLIIETELEIPSMLVVSEMYHKGWKAYVDGQETKVMEVNYMQKGIWLDKGRHSIKFIFSPESLKFGLIASLITIILMHIAVLFVLYRKKSI